MTSSADTPATTEPSTSPRRVVAHLFITLDGVVEAPNEWSLAYWHDDIGADIGHAMSNSDAMLLGRVTYEEFAASWTGKTTEDDPGADHMNGITKYVASRTLPKVEWENSHLLEGDLGEAVMALKAAPGRDIMMSGSATLVRALLDENLLDELDLLLYPVTRGHGARLFPDATQPHRLTLTHSHAYQNGVVRLIYSAQNVNPMTT